MAKINGFENEYKGLDEGIAWRKIYEFGKNLMPIKERILQKKYNKIFNKNTKVIREKILKKIQTDRIVPGDILIIERGDFVPADGKILEESCLEFENTFNIGDDKFLSDKNDKVVYQGMKVKSGKAIIEVVRTGDETYLGNFIKQIDNKIVCESSFEKILRKYFYLILVICGIFFVIGFIFSFINNKVELWNRIGVATYSGLLLLISALPIGSIIVFFIKLIEQKRILYKSNLSIRKENALLKAYKTSVICLDERFLKRNYEKYIQRFYSAGIMIAIISDKKEEELKELAKQAGIFDKDVSTISGKELENLSDEEFYKKICSSVIFYEINNTNREKILQGFDKLNIKTIAIVDNVEDLPILKYADISICTHERKNNLEYEFSDAKISGTDLTSIYSLIKGSCMVKNYLNHYVKYYLMFQTPIILSLLVALLSGIDLKAFYFQTLMLILVIIPLLLLLINRDYSEHKLVELKKRNKKFVIDFLKFISVGIAIGICGILGYIILEVMNVSDLLKIGCVSVFFTSIYFLIIMLSRKKFGIKKIIEDIKNREKRVIKSSVNKKVVPKEHKLKVSKKNKKKIEDMKNEII